MYNNVRYSFWRCNMRNREGPISLKKCRKLNKYSTVGQQPAVMATELDEKGPKLTMRGHLRKK